MTSDYISRLRQRCIQTTNTSTQLPPNEAISQGESVKLVNHSNTKMHINPPIAPVKASAKFVREGAWPPPLILI